MARNARRNYVRDGRGRFSSTPGGGPAKKARPARTSFRQRQAVSLARQRGQTGRLGSATREAKARLAASRKKLGTNASPQQKAAVTRAKRMAAMLAGERRIRTAPQAGVLRGAAGRGVKKGLKSRPQMVSTTPMSRPVPASQRPGSLTSTLRGTLRNLARTDAARIREVEAITGQKLSLSTAGAKAASETGARVRGTAKGGKVAATLRAGLRELAQSDARAVREMASIVRDAKPKVAGAKGGKALRGGKKALPAAGPAKEAGPATTKTAPRNRPPMRERLARAAQTAGRIEKSRWDKVSQLEKKQRRATRAAADAPDNKYNAAEQKRQALQAAKSAATESAKRASRRGARLRLAAATSAQLKPAIRGKGRIRMARPANTVAKPKGLRPGALAESRGVKTKKSKPKAGPGSLQAIATRRARVAKGIKEQDARLLQALRDGTYDSNRGSLERMARRRVTLSAANEIYNRQRTVAKISGKDLDRQLLSSPLAIMPTIRQSKDKREMAAQLRERARERVVKGRKGRR